MSIGLWMFFCKQKTAYEMRISDWSSDVCSSDLDRRTVAAARRDVRRLDRGRPLVGRLVLGRDFAVIGCGRGFVGFGGLGTGCEGKRKSGGGKKQVTHIHREK